MLKIQELEYLVPDFLKNSDLLYVSVMDSEGQIFLSNNLFKQLFKPFGTDNYEKNFLEICHKRNQWDFHDFLIQVIEKPNHKIHVDLVHAHNLLIKWEFSTLQNEEGDFAGILAVGHKFFEGTSLKGQESHTLKPDITAEVKVSLDFNWEITDANLAAETFFDRKFNELIGKTIWQVYPDLNVYQHALEFKKARETKSMRVFEEFNSKNGRYYKVFVYPKNLGLDLVFRDVTEIQGLSAQLLKTKLTLEALMEHSPEEIFFVGKDLRIFGFNNRAKLWVKEQFGKTLKNGDKFLNFLPGDMDEVFLKYMEEILAGQSLQIHKEVLQQPYGNAIWFAHNFYPLKEKDASVRGFVYAMKDIHEDKMSNDKLKKQNKIMREVIHTQSSTLRSPLSSILGLLELIDKNQLDKENKKYFSLLKPLAQELDKVIRNNSKQVSDLD
ncbi:PAS domain S-box protein [Cecembia lonarensis]|uniref:histidine kinase n=1 Tax=Cecembia lonarensis (strain CCUG 58316 / KCTC 22772 / LW9) TaxID=1225176 RepID=K1L2F7_CECL9|nr:PAS domain S-box protein [Cecembia lonarensis]EKB48996.1 aerobic respiration control sensor protein ArcB [Cecembia lonarensis LW9]